MLVAVCLFGLIYIAVSLLAVPPLAAALGRAPLACGYSGQGSYGPLTGWTCLLNRHYATPEARNALAAASAAVITRHPGVRVSYLDAGFPFFDWFPMLPHLSHRDGRKVDLALLYTDPDTGGPAPGRAPSPIGYWGYAPPTPGEPRPCAGNPSWLRWDFDWLQPLLARLDLDQPATVALLDELIESPAVTRILIEPHLKTRFVAGQPKARFQGCAAARHDDHIHLEFR